MIKPAYSVSFLLSINIFVWQNVLYFPNDFFTLQCSCVFDCYSMRIGLLTKDTIRLLTEHGDFSDVRPRRAPFGS